MIGIYGGTFDPVHNGHLIIVNGILEMTKLEKIIIMPTRIPPHKKGKVSADFERRLRWAKIAFDEIENVEISDFENKPDISYTVDTIRHFNKIHGKIAYIMGEDSFVNIDKWYMYEEIVRSAKIYVYPRYCDRSKTLSMIEKFKMYDVNFLPLPIIEISSTVIRERAEKGLSLKGYVPDEIEKEIFEFYSKI
ncbi:nicotinate (nicotinamide) nucleotide adenylyltransferase [Athalassotoga saccharophila]|uniref:nicotinate (nicotinamide) nucleotide adenylyltransferase n=1 Tax=Athalassotoga saccharophila TaxID=1441386 RepID=UPI00137ABCCC|nr:nicotinate (nicotinamide) nucleotide adenylyltransferase [Athalassotoga saccharophila]BBJ27853.1 nicotinate-nucleotide adenylyltransferase [Athalassotoga saccharophila]